jgi:hypothetical protein
VLCGWLNARNAISVFVRAWAAFPSGRTLYSFAGNNAAQARGFRDGWAVYRGKPETIRPVLPWTDGASVKPSPPASMATFKTTRKEKPPDPVRVDHARSGRGGELFHSATANVLNIPSRNREQSASHSMAATIGKASGPNDDQVLAGIRQLVPPASSKRCCSAAATGAVKAGLENRQWRPSLRRSGILVFIRGSTWLNEHRYGAALRHLAHALTPTAESARVQDPPC